MCIGADLVATGGALVPLEGFDGFTVGPEAIIAGLTACVGCSYWKDTSETDERLEAVLERLSLREAL